MLILDRRLAPAALTRFLAQGLFLADFFFDPMLGLPLLSSPLTALVLITGRDYRADIEVPGLARSLAGGPRRLRPVVLK